jgi:protease I
MEKSLEGKKVAILVADGFEQVELTEPQKALEAAGAKTEIVSPAENQVQGWNHDDKADLFDVDMPLKRRIVVAGRCQKSGPVAHDDAGG